MYDSIIRKKVTINEFCCLVKYVLDNGGKVHIYQNGFNDSDKNPYIDFDFSVKKCISTVCGVQFSLQEGNIFLNFRISPTDKYKIEFYRDDEDASRYWVHFGNIILLFNMDPSKFMFLVDNLEENAKSEIEKASKLDAKH